MRVVLFTDSDAFSGTERYILDLAVHLPLYGVEVKIACPVPSPLAARAAREGVPLVPIPKRGLVDWRAAGILRRLLHQGEAEVIHAHNGRTALATALAARSSGRGRFLVSQHFLFPDHVGRSGPKARLFRWAHLWVSQQIDHYIAISGAVRKEMLFRGDAPDRKITVIPNGVRVPDSRSLRPAAQVRAELGLSGSMPLIACVARLELEKNVISLVEAMATIVRTYPGARCVVAGEGFRRPALENRIRELGLQEAVRLLGFREDALSVVNAADLFVLPSLAEPSGLAILEAMALGKAVVATRAGGPTEIVAEGETGLLVPPANPSSLAGALRRLLRDPDLRKAMGEMGAQRFHERFTADHMAQGTLEVYRRVLAGRS